MERAYESKHIFGLKLHFYKDVVDLHYERLNILSLFCYYGNHYCFCSKYKGCVEDYNVRSHLCLLCQVPIHFPNFEEFLDGNQFHLANLKKYARKLYPFLMGCHDVDQTYLVAFLVEYSYSFLDHYTGEKTSFTLHEWIENLTEIKK